MKFAIDMLQCIVTPDRLFRPFKQRQSSREEKRIYMKSRKLYIIITVGCLALWSLLVSLLMLGIHEKRNEIAGLSESKLEDVHYDSFWITYRYDAKGLIIVYSLEDNGWYSSAYWIPFGSTKIMLLK